MKLRFVTSLALVPALGFALTLDEAYRLALKTSETMGRKEADVEAAQAEVSRRKGLLAPTIALDARELIQDTPGASSGNVVQSTFVRRTRPSVVFTLTQPIFSGFRDFAGYSSAKAMQKEREWERRDAARTLYGDVATVYFEILQKEKDLEILGAHREVLTERLRELVRFEALGRTRPSERAVVEGEIRDMEAAMEQVKGDLESYRYLLRFWTGLGEISTLADTPDIDRIDGPLDEILADVAKRPDIEALRQTVRSLEKETTFARGGYWPTVNFNANYYAYQVGFLDDVDWDLSFMLHYPFFQGGQTRAEVRIAEAELRSAKLSLSEAERKVKLEVERAVTQLSYTVTKKEKLKEALSFHEKSYLLQRDDFRKSLVTNLEVLVSLAQLYRARREFETTRYQAKVLSSQLDASRGKIPSVTP